MYGIGILENYDIQTKYCATFQNKYHLYWTN